MSGFVPMQGTRGFSVGVLGEGESAAQPTSVDGGTVVDAAPVEPEIRLPETQEELAVLIDETREQARADAQVVLADIRAELVAEREQLVALVDRVSAGRQAWGNEVRNVLGELVVVGVRQVICESATLQTELLRDRFAEVGERLIGEQDILIRVRPEDEDAARSLVGGREGWTVVPDSDIGGGVIAETEAGKVDATLGAALSGLADSVQEWQAEGVGEE